MSGVKERQPAAARMEPGGMFVTAEPFTDLPWLVHASTTRHFSPADADRVAELWHLQATLGLPKLPIIHADQRHTDTVGTVTEEVLGDLWPDGRYRFPHTDAIVCPFPDISIAIFTADCAPIFLADRRTRAIGLAHCGWQGSFSRMAERTVESMVSCGSDPQDIVAWIGPMAAGCCYEVSEELAHRFKEAFTDASEACVPFCRGRMLDLVALNAFQLRKAGIPAGQVTASGLCTIHGHETFYSYRADRGTTGRVISMMTARSDQ